MRLALLTAVSVCTGVAACDFTGGMQQVSRPQVLLDSYLIAHGMATSYAENPEANLAVVQELARLDHRASDAVRALAHRGGDLSGTAEAVAALTDYAARQTPPPSNARYGLIMDAMSGLSVRGLTVERGGRVVLEDVSFSAPAGAVTAVLGLAGAGKTSLLAAIAGLLPTARGAVFRGGADVSELQAGRRDVALLAPGTMLDGAGAVRAALRRVAGRGRTAAADDCVSALGLAELASRRPGLLSHGESALALTAARLLPEGGALLVDEAGIGLDEEARKHLAALLRMEAAGGRLVLVATRDARLALGADHLVLLAGGQVLQAGTPASLYAEPHSVAAARLTGPANILQGTVRELRPGSFVWSAGGRYVQATDPDTVRPTLGNATTLCLRPERIALLGHGQTAENSLEAGIIDLRSAGALLELSVTARLGPLQVSVSSWGTTPYPGVGQTVCIGWAADAARVLF